ncbi:hypothetical protein ASE63_00720 [Bosea sp. Root381]|uniref:type II toxin-antitoxin system VapC family toxin n=1 Tax=Bosea sp. Root381 TaxID=1736524 RepID=UPI0006F5F222|nr:type II toxin-antitoxin system VapC family toxin [Bosea sp. Root381]KRE17760.1 hypothetical protein ASE63_00720 [Bosea sp. Root381]
MFLDASVVVALLAGEAEELAIHTAIAEAEMAVTSPIAMFEASTRLSRLLRVSFVEAYDGVLAFHSAMNIRVVDVSAEIGREAHVCAARYHHLNGHPAKLNMGDCFAYAAARTLKLQLAYKGNDFLHTDIDGLRFGPDQPGALA